MDLLMEPTQGKPFTMEVGYFDTVLEIKEKIDKYHSIPVAKQTLLFHGQALSDDLNIHNSLILDRSRIQILISSEQPQQQQQQIVGRVPATSTIDSHKINLLLKLPNSKLNVKFEIDATDSIQLLKERIQEMDGVPASRLVLRSQGIELQDSWVIGDYNLSERSEIEISAKPSPATSSSTGSGSGNANSNANVNANNNNVNQNNSSSNTSNSNGGGGSKRTMAVSSATGGGGAVLVVRVVVQTGKSESRKVLVEVNGCDSVGVLRKELEKMRQRGVVLPAAEGYFFIYKQNVMDEDRSFRWHGVVHGDTIEIFNGSVSGGS